MVENYARIEVKAEMASKHEGWKYARIEAKAEMARKNQDMVLEGVLWITRGLRLRRKWRVSSLRDEGRRSKILPPEHSGCL